MPAPELQKRVLQGEGGAGGAQDGGGVLSEMALGPISKRALLSSSKPSGS